MARGTGRDTAPRRLRAAWPWLAAALAALRPSGCRAEAGARNTNNGSSIANSATATATTRPQQPTFGPEFYDPNATFTTTTTTPFKFPSEPPPAPFVNRLPGQNAAAPVRP